MEVDPPVGADQTIGKSLLGGRFERRSGTGASGPEQAARQGADRIPAGTGAEVQDQAGVAGEAGRLGAALKFLDQAGLADAGLAAEMDRVAGAGLEAGPQDRFELAELGAPADEGPPGLVPRLAQALEAPGLDRLGEALDREPAELPALEPLGEHRAHAVGDQDDARRGGRGQARGQIDRIAGDRIAAVAGPAARHHLAARDADVGTDVVAELAAQLGQRRPDLERGADRALGVVAVGQRRAEHRHHAVADVLVDGAAIALDDAVEPARRSGRSERARPRRRARE
jgi:hypothetical protein